MRPTLENLRGYQKEMAMKNKKRKPRKVCKGSEDRKPTRMERAMSYNPRNRAQRRQR